jgi:hypothetical protein
VSTSVPPPGLPDSAPTATEPEPTSGSRKRTQLPRLLVLAGVVVTLVVVALVAFGSSGNSSLDPVAQAATASANAPGFSMRITMRISAPGIRAPITATGTGSFNTGSREGGLTFTMNTPRGAMSFQEVLSGHVVYLKLPSAISGALPLGGKPWVSLDFTKLKNFPGIGSLLNNPASGDPSEMLQYLRAVSDSVVAKGGEQVNGIATTHYQAQIDFDRVPAALPESVRADAQKAIAAIESQTHIHTVPVSVWVDSHHLVRRMEMSMSPTLPTGGSATESFTFDFLKYGPQHAPAVPPSSQVADLSQLLNSGG